MSKFDFSPHTRYLLRRYPHVGTVVNTALKYFNKYVFFAGAVYLIDQYQGNLNMRYAKMHETYRAFYPTIVDVDPNFIADKKIAHHPKMIHGENPYLIDLDEKFHTNPQSAVQREIYEFYNIRPSDLFPTTDFVRSSRKAWKKHKDKQAALLNGGRPPKDKRKHRVTAPTGLDRVNNPTGENESFNQSGDDLDQFQGTNLEALLNDPNIHSNDFALLDKIIIPKRQDDVEEGVLFQ